MKVLINSRLSKVFFIFLLSIAVTSNGQDNKIKLNWLTEKAPAIKSGVSWGVPWPRGLIKTGQEFILTGQTGEMLPVQTWPLAYWPDGSLKWIGFSTVADTSTGSVTIMPGNAVRSSVAKVEVKETTNGIKVKSDKLACIIPAEGRYIIDSLMVNSLVVGSRGRLECILQEGAASDPYKFPTGKRFTGNTENVTVEQNGPVRSVIRVQGTFKEENGLRKWLPFDIRLYFYAGSNSIRIVNTFIYDGDEQKDFIKGLSLGFTVPMRDELYNRHVRFAGEMQGIWAEPVKPLVNRAGMIDGRRVYPDQIAGRPVTSQNPIPGQIMELINNMPFWNDYILIQSNANGFNIQKRTNTSSAWIDVNAGKRAGGLVFAGDTKGGLSVGLKDFWQSYPSGLEINNAAGKSADIKVWLWSPYSEVMDMRHYDTVGHGLAAVYEDVQEGLSTPYGIGRTSEITLFLNESVPSNDELSNQANISSRPPLLTVTPEYLHSVEVFGLWSLPDRSAPGKKWIEDQLDNAIALYKKEIDQRNWYGFWNYGDIMHAYDPVRHSWNYDIGGYAWDNTELASDLWLWYSFIRSGREDIFTMAEAMSRHTSEVDLYHIGELKGLGSRHNVRHWGCGSKEVRESQSASRRFYYYLTTDERTGDIMREVAENADYSMSKLDPLRLILPKTQYPTHARIGPDWLALVGNWMTEWERTGDNKWLNYIMAGVNSFSRMPYGFYSGQQAAFGYDPATKIMYKLNDEIGHSHLSVLMGGPEVAFELTELMQDKKWTRLWMQFCTLWGAPEDEVRKAFRKKASVGVPDNNWYGRLPAYVYYKTNDPKYAERAWNWFLNSTRPTQFEIRTVSAPEVFKTLEEAPSVTTNTTAQWCLNAIEMLEMAGEKLPLQHPLWNNSVQK